MILFLTFGLISVSVMVVSVIELRSLSRRMMESVTQLEAVHKSNFLIVKKIPKPFSEVIGQGKLHQVQLASLTSVRDVILDGTRDISGLGRLWAVFSPMISLKELKSLPSPLKNGSQKILLSKYGKITRVPK